MKKIIGLFVGLNLFFQAHVLCTDSVWAVGANGSVWFREGITDANLKGTSWSAVPDKGGFTNISVGANGQVWGISDFGAYFRKGITPTNLKGDGWIAAPFISGAPFLNISVGPNGSVWAVASQIGSGKKVYFGVGIADANPLCSSWVNLGDNINNVSIAPSGKIWAVSSSINYASTNNIYTGDGMVSTNQWSFVATLPTTAPLLTVSAGGNGGADVVWVNYASMPYYKLLNSNEFKIAAEGVYSISDVSAGPNGSVWHVNKQSGTPYFRTGITSAVPQGSGWQAVDKTTAFIGISVGSAMVLSPLNKLLKSITNYDLAGLVLMNGITQSRVFQSAAFQGAQGGDLFYGKLGEFYRLRSAPDNISYLNSLKTLLINAAASVILTDAQKSDVYAWRLPVALESITTCDAATLGFSTDEFPSKTTMFAIINHVAFSDTTSDTTYPAPFVSLLCATLKSFYDNRVAIGLASVQTLLNLINGASCLDYTQRNSIISRKGILEIEIKLLVAVNNLKTAPNKLSGLKEFLGSSANISNTKNLRAQRSALGSYL